MNYFSGFCLKNEKELFRDYLEDGDFIVAGFSYGAQKAVDFALNSDKRIDKLILISPAFFDYNKKIIELNLNAFKENKYKYIDNFLTKAGLIRMESGEWRVENVGSPKNRQIFWDKERELRMESGECGVPEKSSDFLGQRGRIENREILSSKFEVRYDCNEEELLSLFTFDWEKIKQINNIKIEVFLGEYDKIISLKKAYKFFIGIGNVYLIKKANHFLRS